MEAYEWMHYCEKPYTKQLVLCNVKDPKAIQIRNIMVPYDSLYIFDTTQVQNIIFFTGGGTSASEQFPEQYFQITMKITIMKSSDTMDIIKDKLSNMNVPRANHTMIAIANKKLYVVGGYNSAGNISSCEEYDIDENKWRIIPSLNEKKKQVSVCSYKDQYLYAFGGCISDKVTASEIIEYLDTKDSLAKTWESIKIVSGLDLFKNTHSPGVVAVSADCILVFGGVTNDKIRDLCLEFDPIKKTFIKAKSLLEKDWFYTTKYGMKTESFSIVGCRNGGLHTYDKLNKKWEFMPKPIWNPNYAALKSDTY